MNGSALQLFDFSHSNQYFDNATDSVEKGKVETPNEVVDFMVSMTISEIKLKKSGDIFEIKWLDPACGTGAFVIGILQYYLKHFPEMQQTELPIITAVEIDPTGIEISKSRVEEILVSTGYDFKAYLNSGRLTFLVGDYLNYSGTNVNLFESTIRNIDVAIGNPPYVRSNNISGDQKARIRATHSDVYEGSTDLYGYFYSGCLNVIRENALICLITPVNFMKSVSFKKVRRKLKQNCQLLTFVDFGERPIFNAASVHSAIFLFKKSVTLQNTRILDKSQGRAPFSILESNILNGKSSQLSEGVGGRWVFNSNSLNVDSIESSGKTIKSAGLQVFSGIRTGKATAFLLQVEDIRKFKEPESQALCESIIMPTDIQAWKCANPSRRLLNLTKKSPGPTPEIIEHLKPYEDELTSRCSTIDSSGWYQIRTCDYLDEMRKRKIVFPDISTKPRFGIGAEGELVSDGAYFINSTDSALLAILNSKFALRYFQDHCLTIGSLSNGGRLRVKKNIVLDFPLPDCWDTECKLLTDLRRKANLILNDSENVEEIIKIDDLVEKLYRTHNE